MGRRTDLTDDEKRIIVKEFGNATTPEMIAIKKIVKFVSLFQSET